MISDQDGERLVKTARSAVTEFLKTGKKITLNEDFKSRFSYHSGLFVTLNIDEKLRGCIGFPTPEKKLYQSLVDAAVAAATKDPRFPSVKFEELSDISFEVTVLTPLEEIKVENNSEYPTKIRVGRDGLIIRSEFGAGLLLPQVPVESGWDEEEFLNHVCEKADLPRDCWKRQGVKIFRFEGTIFEETSPHGFVIRNQL